MELIIIYWIIPLIQRVKLQIDNDSLTAHI